MSTRDGVRNIVLSLQNQNFWKNPCKNVEELFIYYKNCLYPIWQYLPKEVKEVGGEKKALCEKIAVTSDYH